MEEIATCFECLRQFGFGQGNYTEGDKVTCPWCYADLILVLNYNFSMQK